MISNKAGDGRPKLVVVFRVVQTAADGLDALAHAGIVGHGLGCKLDQDSFFFNSKAKQIADVPSGNRTR